MVSLGNSVRERKFTLAMVRNSLLNEEIRKDFLINDTHALVMENRVEAKTENYLSKTYQEVDTSLE